MRLAALRPKPNLICLKDAPLTSLKPRTFARAKTSLHEKSSSEKDDLVRFHESPVDHATRRQNHVFELIRATTTDRIFGDNGVSRKPEASRRPNISEKDRQNTSLRNVCAVIKHAIANISYSRHKPWFRARVGFNPKDPTHCQRLDDWLVLQVRDVSAWQYLDSAPEAPRYKRLHHAWIEQGTFGVEAQLRFSLTHRLMGEQKGRAVRARQSELLDLRYPADWSPLARSLTRHIHLHIGPTNSGKTYHALQRLMKAKSGLYAGPLRLLAHEVYGRLLNAGRSCHLVTGDERILSDDPECMLSSCTVEMTNLNVQLDVAVIDEIQMLGDAERGWAWTAAVLALQASEIHLCGEARSLPLVRALAASTGDKLIVHEYERLSPLAAGEESLDGDLTKVEPGDCLVAFSRRRIHALSYKLGQHVPGKVAVIYGSMPPGTRARQAQLFNDPNSGYDIIVASNAIGMGLNLNIRRIIFTEVDKFDGRQKTKLAVADVKQIGGRAGRFRVAPTIQPTASKLDIADPAVERVRDKSSDSVGIVTTLWESDLKYVRSSMDREPPPIKHAGLKIPDYMIIQYAAYYPQGTPLSYILSSLYDTVEVGQTYMLSHGDDLGIADTIEVVTKLTLPDRLIITGAPAELADPTVRETLLELCRHIASGARAKLMNLISIPLRHLDMEVEANILLLRQLEQLHKCLTLYIWLAFRFPSILVTRELAEHARELAEERITDTLALLAEQGKGAIGRRNDPVRDVDDEDVQELDIFLQEQAGDKQVELSSGETRRSDLDMDEQRLRELIADDEPEIRQVRNGDDDLDQDSRGK